jgi:hypothetical protein
VIARARCLTRQAGALARVGRTGARVYGASTLSVARRARLMRVRQGYEYDEALREGLLDPSLPDEERLRHASRHATLEAQRRLNPDSVAPLTGEKAIFYPYCEAVGLRTPALFGVVDVRGGGGWSHTGRVLTGAAGFADFVEHDLPDEVVVKPSGGYHGRGVRVLVRRGEGFAGAPTPAALLASLRSDTEFGVYVFQERLHNHPVLAELCGAETLHTLRIVTLVERDGSCEALYAVLRLGLAGGATDNFEGGLTGNGLASVDMATGALGPLKLLRDDGCGFVLVPEVPATGVGVEGVRLPDWEEAVEMTREATLRFAPIRTLGWDVGLTPSGPMLMEANAFWWPRSSPEQGALVDRLKNS